MHYYFSGFITFVYCQCCKMCVKTEALSSPANQIYLRVQMNEPEPLFQLS